jgi:hypothetical protein
MALPDGQQQLWGRISRIKTVNINNEAFWLLR